MDRALAVTRYTLVELTRRWVVLVFVAIGILLHAGLGIAPIVIPGIPTGQERSLFLLEALSEVSVVITLCAYAVGMTVINHDLDSGTVVAIFAKPLSRDAYALGKLIAATLLLIVIDLVFMLGSMLVVAINGGGHMATLFWFFVVTAANVVWAMILVMLLTVYINNIVAAVVVFVFGFISGILITLHTAIQSNVITNGALRAFGDVVYWVVPHSLLSNLQRDIVATAVRLHPNAGRGNPLATTPGASGAGDIVFWIGYLAVILLLLFVAVRRKQV